MEIVLLGLVNAGSAIYLCKDYVDRSNFVSEFLKSEQIGNKIMFSGILRSDYPSPVLDNNTMPDKFLVNYSGFFSDKSYVIKEREYFDPTCDRYSFWDKLSTHLKYGKKYPRVISTFIVPQITINNIPVICNYLQYNEYSFWDKLYTHLKYGKKYSNVISTFIVPQITINNIPVICDSDIVIHYPVTFGINEVDYKLIPNNSHVIVLAERDGDSYLIECIAPAEKQIQKYVAEKYYNISNTMTKLIATSFGLSTVLLCYQYFTKYKK